MEEISLRNDDQAPPSNERQFPLVNTTEGIPRSLPRAADQARVEAVNEHREQHQEASETVSYDLYMEKSKELHKLTLKMKQYEFAVQEAILFLSKPLNSYQDWIDREDSSRLGDSLAAALALPKAGPASRTSTISATATPSKTQPSPHSKVFSFGSTDSKQNQAANTSTATPPQNENLSDLEVSCLENMRMCFNFLRNSQKSGKAIDDGTYSVPKGSQLNAMENESLALIDSSRLSRDSTSSSQLPILKEENVVGGGSNSNLAASASLSGRLSKTSKPDLLFHPTTTTTSSYPNAKVYDDHDIGGDLSLEQLADFKPSSSKCEKCRSALLALDEARDKLKASESKISDLESRLEKETKAKKVCQQAKNLIDLEIEEITAELFARANQMVVDESRRMDMLNTSNRELTKRVGDLTSRLREKEVELANATRSLYQAQSVQSHHSLNKYSVPGGGEEKFVLRKSSSIATAPPPPSLPVLPTNPLSFSEKEKVVVVEEESTTSLSPPPPPPQTSDQVSSTSTMQQEKTPSPLPDTFTHYIISGFDAFSNNPAADGHLFSEFQDLIKSLVLTSSLPSHQALLAIHATAFMKRCLVESVEPCLYYSFTAAGAGQGPPKPTLFKKKVLEKVIKGHVVVVADEGGGSGGGGRNKCCMCVMSRVCEYKLSFANPTSTSTTMGGGPAISQPSSSISSEPICRFCRDRVLAVQDFFSYLSFLASGTGRHGLTILSAFKQIMWTRRRMAVAVIGSCSLFESQVSAILGPGAGGNWEKDTKTLY